MLLALTLLAAGLSGAAPAAAGPPSTATRAATCQGAVVHSVDAAQPGTLPSLCIAVGGVVRVVNTGPGSLLAEPATMTDCFYAAGTYQCRLIRTGTVRLSLAPGARELLVRVPAAVPGQPSTACSPAGSVVDLDTNDELRWWSPCLRAGATLRVVNLGPGLLSATPAGAVNCHYEAGIHACQFRRPASVVLTATVDATTRSVTAVAVR
ncbi:hypothetical protein [Actinoplanes flavus]|uniref:Ig-like domain-containing protein n=1 Tax=Actinoplanes flavus TaxID=2820290 RepID=A0ABS3URI6_9ACTN|nr:hypothetical protein [Actinoplanes flavus]MBO3741131.1 hypothetical protein [Actinoplanes flavus]